MKYPFLTALVWCAALGTANAQTSTHASSYAGAVGGLMEVGGGCATSPAQNCDHRGKFTKLYGGAQVSPLWFVEAALIDFGKSQFATDDKATAHAIALSLAYRQEVFKRLTLSTRLGLAYVQTNLKMQVPNQTTPNVVTTQKLQPILGLCAEIAITDMLSAVASADFSRIKIQEHSARVNAYGVGLSLNFDQAK